MVKYMNLHACKSSSREKKRGKEKNGVYDAYQRNNVTVFSCFLGRPDGGLVSFHLAQSELLANLEVKDTPTK